MFHPRPRCLATRGSPAATLLLCVLAAAVASLQPAPVLAGTLRMLRSAPQLNTDAVAGVDERPGRSGRSLFNICDPSDGATTALQPSGSCGDCTSASMQIMNGRCTCADGYENMNLDDSSLPLSCVPCTGGLFSVGGAECTNCPNFRFSTDGIRCNACVTGYSNTGPLPDGPLCVPCGHGSYAKGMSVAVELCTSCPANTVQVPPAKGCGVCDRGYENTGVGSSPSCTPCDDFKHQPYVKGGACNKCPSGRISYDGIHCLASFVVVAGAGSSCAIRGTDGQLFCWGSNGQGQLGTGDTAAAPTPVAVATGVKSVSIGSQALSGSLNTHMCLVNSTGAIACVGDNNYGTASDNSTAEAIITVLTPMSTITEPATAVVCGGINTCALMQSTGIKCWGWDLVGGDGDMGANLAASSLAPVDVVDANGEAVAGATALACGAGHCCAAVRGVGMCWGYNLHGQVGNSRGMWSTVATPVDGLPRGVVAVAAAGLGGGRENDPSSCAIMADSTLYCWGGFADINSGIAVQLMFGGVPAKATAVSLSITHACVLGLDATLKCFGHNTAGQFGSAVTTIDATTLIPSTSPVTVATGVDSVSVGIDYTCFVDTSSNVKCLGANSVGQLGDGGSEEYSSSPVTVLSPSP